MGVDRVIFSKVSVYKCLLSVDGELAVRSCNLLECVCVWKQASFKVD